MFGAWWSLCAADIQDFFFSRTRRTGLRWRDFRCKEDSKVMYVDDDDDLRLLFPELVPAPLTLVGVILEHVPRLQTLMLC